MSERRHATIMFTDIVGYTALMGSDEDRAFEVLGKNREVHVHLIKKFKGTLIKEMGDGMLISFDLASDAVRCSIEIQKACKSHDIPLKIGIHEGEMVFEGHDVLGDGVNIASRIQDDAQEGCIFISSSVYRDIKNKADIKTKFIEEKSFKNVDEPVKVYLVGYEGGPDIISHSENLENKQSRRKSIIYRPFIKISSVIIAIMVVGVFFLFYSGTSLPFAERDWVVIADFENLTDEPIFDHSLNTAFTLSINQSRYVNVITRQRMHEALKRMKKENIVFIDEETVREIALREGVKICIVPNISRVGAQYILTAKIQEAKTAAILKSEILYAKNQDDIIEKLDRLTKKTRRNLGESRYEIFEQSKPLSKVTTSSLDALKQYSLGVENHINLDFEKAKTHYENAIRIDSNFTSAKASLGNLLFEKFDREEGRKWLEEAIVSIDHLTEREKYGILAFYAVNVEQDMEIGIEYTQTRIDMYPDDAIARNNLGWYYQNSGLYKDAVAEYQAAIRIDPYLMLPYSGLIRVLQEKLGQFDTALVWTNQMIRYNPENTWGYFYLGNSFVSFDDLESAVENYRKSVELNPKMIMSQYRLAHTHRIVGEYDKAIEVLRNILITDPDEISAYYDMGVNYRYSGEEELARNCFKDYLEKAEKWEEIFPQNPGTYSSIGAGWIRLGEVQKGWEIGKKAIEIDSTFHFDFAVFLSILGKKEEALDHLEKALKNGYRDLVWIKLNSGFDTIRFEARFQRLMTEHFGS